MRRYAGLLRWFWPDWMTQRSPASSNAMALMSSTFGMIGNPVSVTEDRMMPVVVLSSESTSPLTA